MKDEMPGIPCIGQVTFQLKIFQKGKQRHYGVECNPANSPVIVSCKDQAEVLDVVAHLLSHLQGNRRDG